MLKYITCYNMWIFLKYFITFHIFSRTDSAMTATRAEHKTAVPAVVSLLAILHRKYVNKTTGLSRRTNFTTLHLLVLYCVSIVTVSY
jgi:hypothetical protein